MTEPGGPAVGGVRPGAPAIVLRLLMLLAPLGAVAVTWLAAGRTVPAVGVVVGVLALVSAAAPDGHAGLLVVLAVGVQWVATVPHTTSPWTLVAASAVAVFHAANAAATVAAPGSAWSRAMVLRWVRRTLVLVAAGGATWVASAVAGGRHTGGGSAALLVASLLTLAAAGLWAREGHLGRGPLR